MLFSQFELKMLPFHKLLTWAD